MGEELVKEEELAVAPSKTAAAFPEPTSLAKWDSPSILAVLDQERQRMWEVEDTVPTPGMHLILDQTTSPPPTKPTVIRLKLRKTRKHNLLPPLKSST